MCSCLIFFNYEKSGQNSHLSHDIANHTSNPKTELCHIYVTNLGHHHNNSPLLHGESNSPLLHSIVYRRNWCMQVLSSGIPFMWLVMCQLQTCQRGTMALNFSSCPTTARQPFKKKVTWRAAHVTFHGLSQKAN